MRFVPRRAASHKNQSDLLSGCVGGSALDRRADRAAHGACAVVELSGALMALVFIRDDSMAQRKG
jgi:hypothetical protein